MRRVWWLIIKFPIGGGGILDTLKCVKWGDTISVNFEQEADLLYTQVPPFPTAFLPPVPSGHFYEGDSIGPRTALPVLVTVTLYYVVSGTEKAAQRHFRSRGEMLTEKCFFFVSNILPGFVQWGRTTG